MPHLIVRKAETAFTSSFQINSSDDDSLTFDTDSYACILDNIANTHIWNNANDFIPGTLRDYTNTEKVITIGNPSLPKGIGNKQVHWKYDSGKMHSHILTDVLFFPDSPVKITSITKLAHKMNDETGTWIKTIGNKYIFSWDYEKAEQTIYHPPSNLPELMLSKGYHDFQSYCTLSNKT